MTKPEPAQPRPPSKPLTEVEIIASAVGEPSRADGQIELSEYDPRWPALFEREAARVRSVLGSRVIQLEHTGSTSVPGLAAKPRIDMLLVVADSSDETAWAEDLVAAGYRIVIREPDWYQHRVLQGPDTKINLHVLSAGSPEIERILAFRDRLRTNAEDRALYERTKRDLAGRDWAYVQNYADAKSEVVEAIIARAMAERDNAR